MERRDLDPRGEGEEEEDGISKEGALARVATATAHAVARTALFTLAMAACAAGLMVAMAALGAWLL